MGYKKYLIWAPPYRRSSSGVAVLHKLCHLLNEKGLTAYVTGRPNPEWKEHRADKNKIKELISEDAIVVYPEHVIGNPFHAKYVVRYILQKHAFPKRWSKHEILFCHSPFLERYVDRPGRILEIPWIELELFNNDSNYARSGSLFYVGRKCSNTPRIKQTESATEITSAYPPTHKELADLFKKSELFYSYDNFTALTVEARLCGCPVVLIPEKRFSREEILCFGNVVGLSYGLDDIEHAKQTVHKFADVYKEEIKRCFNLDNFIGTTQEATGAGHGYPDIDIALGFLFNYYSSEDISAAEEVKHKEKYISENLSSLFLEGRLYLFFIIMAMKLYFYIFKKKIVLNRQSYGVRALLFPQEIPEFLIRFLQGKTGRIRL